MTYFLSLTDVRPSCSITHDTVTILRFSHDSQFLAAADSAHRVTLYYRNMMPTNPEDAGAGDNVGNDMV